MPAPDRTTVDRGSAAPSCKDGDGGAVRKLESAATAPVMVFAFRGMMLGAGRGPVKGIRMKGGFVMEELASTSALALALALAMVLAMVLALALALASTRERGGGSGWRKVAILDHRRELGGRQTARTTS